MELKKKSDLAELSEFKSLRQYQYKISYICTQTATSENNQKIKFFKIPFKMAPEMLNI